jgi:hypothetical protein
MMITMQGKYQTRDGRAVRILATGMRGTFSVAGIVTERDGSEHIFSWQENGKADFNAASVEWNANSDLIPVPTKHEGFIIVGKDGFVWGQNVVSTIGEAIESGFQKEEGDHIVRVHWGD